MLQSSQCYVHNLNANSLRRQILRRDTSHGTQPAGVERADEEVHHDVPKQLLVELRDQGRARHLLIKKSFKFPHTVIAYHCTMCA